MGVRVETQAAQLGVYVRQWRMVLNLSAAQVADRAGIGRDTLRRLEHGDPAVGLGTTLQVLQVLGQLDRVVTALNPLGTDLGRSRATVLHRRRTRTAPPTET